MNELELKWGTIKGWHLESEEALKLAEEYDEEGVCLSVMAQKDTPRQKEIILELIDLCDSIYLHWDGKCVTKEEAKEYINTYDND